MKKENYSELLKDPRWQKKRLEIMQRDEFTCQHCGCDTEQLMIHHLVYNKGCNPWEYDDDDLLTLCWDCHRKEHLAKDEVYTAFLYLKEEWANTKLSYSILSKLLIDIGFAIGNKKSITSDSIYNFIKEEIDKRKG